jgi:hypothetical protein
VSFSCNIRILAWNASKRKYVMMKDWFVGHGGCVIETASVEISTGDKEEDGEWY